MREESDKILSKFVDLELAEKKHLHSIPPPEKCDLCSCAFSDGLFFVDGAVEGEHCWANMCSVCFLEHGKGVCWGSGQMYMRQDSGKWLMVAGFPPGKGAVSSEEDEDSGTVECSFCSEEFPRDEMVEFKPGEFGCRDCEQRASEILGAWVEQEESKEQEGER